MSLQYTPWLRLEKNIGRCIHKRNLYFYLYSISVYFSILTCVVSSHLCILLIFSWYIQLLLWTAIRRKRIIIRNSDGDVSVYAFFHIQPVRLLLSQHIAYRHRQRYFTIRKAAWYILGGPKMAPFLYALTLPNITDFHKLSYSQD